MSVGTACEAGDSPSGSIATADETKTTVTRRFLVQASDLNVGPFEVLNAVGVPRPYQIYSFFSDTHQISRVVSRDAQRLESGSVWWEVNVSYESRENEEEDDPLNEIPEIEWDGKNIKEVIQGVIAGEDFGDGIRSSAGELVNPALTRDVNNPSLTITRNEDIFTPIESITQSFANSVNNDTFWGFKAGWARMLAPKVSRQTKEIDDEGTLLVYLKITYRIEFSTAPKGFDISQLDHGGYFIKNGDKIFFKTEDGHPFVGLLDGAGGESATPVFLPPKRIYRRQTFATLNLPQSFLDI